MVVAQSTIGDTFLIELEFRSIGFCGEGKTGVQGKNLSEKGREPTTNQDVLTAFRKRERDVFFPMCPREMCKFYTRKAVHAFINCNKN